MNDPDPLVDLLVTALPPQFVAALQTGLANVYEEAHQRAFVEPAWDSIEGRYIAPHLRRVLFEALMRRSAMAACLHTSTETNIIGNYTFTTVRAGKLVITGSALPSSDDIVRPAEFRKQNAAVNSFLTNLPLPFMKPFDLNDVESLYAIIVHAPMPTDKRQCGYAAICIPSEDTNEWIIRRTLSEISKAQAAVHHVAAEVQLDLAVPIKKKGEGAASE